MSRGGGRGGRGGRRGGAPALPWEGEETDTRPSDLFPPFKVPTAKPLSAREGAAVDAFLLIRLQTHESPLHTTRKQAAISVTASSTQKHYGQAQLNAKYAAAAGASRTRAAVDPFTAVPTYSQRFTRQERTLPDFSSRPYCPEFIPKELHDTFEGIEGERGVAKGKRKRITLSRVTALPTAEDVFGITLNGDYDEEWAEGEEDEEFDGHNNKKRTMEALARIGMEDETAEGGVDDEELDEGQEEEQDEEYDDEDAGDYNAEEYFDNGDEGDDDMGGDDDGGRDEY
ncbi:DNA-directed RNA polymerase III, subunit Rpc31 [Plectosphaerella plurivora]|uniref:DNA-directed RNA polymerase III subunit n=1 Tax=Plectosphaerella plurivora TaxID=936078 RepID=A0A9P8V8U9_9PEZI|nr:DNA-directed RNA polymerase III, subunit Rpc31 [Plectosphaerella plurivora]